MIAARPRVGIAGIFHESNTFVSKPMTLTAFGDAWHTGDDIVEALAGTQTVTGGFIAGARAHELQLAPAVHVWGTPAGPLERSAFRTLAATLADGLSDVGRLDGLLLELHGAMVADGIPQADGVLAEVARRAVGSMPIVAVIDPHANVSDRLVTAVDVLITYRTNPHVDMAERGAEAAGLLARVLAGRCRPRMAALRIPLIAPAIAQATAHEPLLSLLGRVREAETRPGILSASLAIGFAHADVPELGMTAIAVADGDGNTAIEVAGDIASAAWDAREAFARQLATAEDAVAVAATLPGPTMLVDTGDNVGGGAPGDSTVLAAAVLARGDLRAVTTICDPVAVDHATAAGTGSDITVTVGEPPLALTGSVRAICDGRYVNDGPLSRGVEFDMGNVVVLDAGPLTVVLQSKAVMANDQNMLRSVGIDVAAYEAVILKGAAAVRAGWAPVAARFVDAATPGATTSDIATLPYSHIQRPIWPLDRFSWDPANAGGAT